MTYSTVFVTVGTTKFEDLLKTVDTEDFFKALDSIGCKHLIIQKGNGEYTPSREFKKIYLKLFHFIIYVDLLHLIWKCLL
jgi:beta-1,4-N-acetylglucosaminyltransferase